MTIAGLGGEFAFIDRIAATQGAGIAPRDVKIGIGDDAAVLHVGGDFDLLVTTDLLLEDVHFRRSYGDPYSLGVKAAAVNLSDIAAMGGTPTAAFISLAVPKDTTVAYLDELYRGLNETFARWGASVAGGDTNIALDRITVNVTQLGTVRKDRAVRRSTARLGDLIVVTGSLGAAAAGFALLEAVGRAEAEAVSPNAVTAQLRPIPQFHAAAAATHDGRVTAMMDISDGLVGDLTKLCRASRVGAVVKRATVPIADAAREAAAHLGLDPIEWALYGGEDYQLLLTVAPGESETSVPEALAASGIRASVVGRIVDGVGVSLTDADGTTVLAVRGGGWDHFTGA